MKTAFRLILLSLVLILFISLTLAQDDYQILRVRNGTDDTPTLDPARANDMPSIQVIHLVAPGLTMLGEFDGATIPAIATSWDVAQNDDGTVTYTFHMVEGLSWVYYDAASDAIVQAVDDAGNVRYVTANDVKYGMLRTINPETGGDYAALLFANVVGGAEYYDGTGAPDDVAITGVDDYTIQITAPFAFVLQPTIYGLWMSRPQPQWAIEEYADFWTEGGNYQSYGPYALKEWIHNDHMTLLVNPFWPGVENIPVPAIDEIQLYFRDETVALQMYEAGELDHLDTVASADLDRVRADPVLSQEFTITSGTCTQYYGFNVTLEPTNNVHLRRALSWAVDREAIVDNVLKAGQIPAQWFALPGLNASPTLEDNPDLGIWFDPEQAQAEFQLYMDEMGYTSVGQIPPLAILINAGTTNEAIAETIQQMWADVLGFDVQITVTEFATYLDLRDNSPLWRGGWCLDIPDAHNFLYEVFHSGSGNNHTAFANAEFDALVDQAMRETDTNVRRDLYIQADQILVNTEAAIIPLWYSVELNMTKPYVEATEAVDLVEYYYNWDVTNP